MSPGNSGRAGSDRGPSDTGSARRSGLSDRWSDDDNGQAPTAEYNMNLPEADRATLTMASPLMQHDSMHEDGVGGEGAGDVEAGKNFTDSGVTVPAGRGAQEFGARSSAPKDVRDHVKAVIEQNKELVQPSVVRNLILTYSITVLVVILLSIAGQVAVHVYIENSQSDAVIINVSGRQRMLSQLMTKDALTLAFLAVHPNSTVNGPNSTYFLKELQAKFPLWKAAHDALINGSAAAIPNLPKLPGTNLGEVLTLSALQQQHFDAMANAVETILAIPTITNITAGTADFDNLATQIDVLLANEGQFWKLQDNMTLYYQQNADSHLRFVLILSWVLHALVILTLILEGLLVFWPVARSMQRLIDERFNLIRRSLESEAENRGVSILMMGYISHELKQPLATLTEHLENARDFLRSLESQAAMGTGPGALAAGAVAGTAGGAGAVDPALRGAVVQIDKARTCLELLNTVSGDITNLRNIELGRMALVVEVVDVADVIQQVLSTLAPKVPEGVQMMVEVAPAIEAQNRRLDRHRLQQILLNLVDNAFRTTREGEVVVRAREGKSASTIRFEVQDSGEGLTEEQQQSLYEPVMDSSGIRTGNANLSLYVVKLLVDLQNGKYGVDRIPGGGNLHWVELPAVSSGKTDPTTNMGALRETSEGISGRSHGSSGRVVPENI